MGPRKLKRPGHVLCVCKGQVPSLAPHGPAALVGTTSQLIAGHSPGLKEV